MKSGDAAGRHRQARRFGKSLWRAHATELSVSTAATFAVLVLLALTRTVAESADLVINRGLGSGAVGAVAFFQMAPVAAQTLPFAVLIGVLVGLGRLHADGELIAIEASGVHPLRLLYPVLSVALVLAAVTGSLSVFWAPEAQRGLSEALTRIADEHSSATLRAGVVERFGERELLAREVSADGRRLRGVLLWNPAAGEAMFAERAELSSGGAGRTIAELTEVAILAAPGSTYQLLRVERFRTDLIRESETDFLRKVVSDPLTLADFGTLVAIARNPSQPAEARLATAEVHRRLALPVSLVVFSALALALVLGSERSSRASAALWGVALAIVYYGLEQVAQGLLRFPSFPAPIAVWLPNAGFSVVSLLGLWRRRGGARLSGSAAPFGWAGRWQRGAGESRGSRPRRWALDRYVLSSFAELTLVALVVLTISYLAVDVMERFGWFARHGAAPGEVLHFYSARIFLLISRVTPMAFLAGAALCVAWLERNRELLAMQASGIRLARALAPIVVASGLAIPLCFLFTELWVPRMTALSDEIKEQEIKDGRGKEGIVAWYRHGEQLVHVSRLALAAGNAEGLTVFRLDADGLPTQRIDARVARHLGGGRWELEGGRRVEMSRDGIGGEFPETMLQLEGVEIGLADPMHMNVWELAGEIERARNDGYDTTAYRSDWHRKLAAPLACLLLPVLTILQAAARREPRSLSLAFLLSAALGISYLVLGDVTTALAYGGLLPPVLAGWAVPLLLLALVIVLAWRTRR